MPTIAPTTIERAFATYQYAIADLRKQQKSNEGNLRAAFATLLRDIGKPVKWTLVEEYSQRIGTRSIYYDGVLCDEWRLPHGYWEAKDGHDDLDREIQDKRAKGYSFANMLFEDTHTLVLFQNGLEVQRCSLDDSAAAVKILGTFIQYEVAPFTKFEQAISYFSNEIPTLAKGLAERITEAHKSNAAFRTAYTAFLQLCQASLNPNLAPAAVDEMLIQHMLTERLMRKLFDEDFVQHNVIAREVERVITALTSASFNRREFLGSLDRFYTVIEDAAAALANFSERQHFINTVYERFFQGYSVKTADTHGIVYTPQPIVDFMCASVEEVLKNEFDLELGAPGVTVLDPCTGTGNFVVNLLGRVSAKYIDEFYKQQLFANEVMLMPYYIASLNIEATYYQRRGQRAPFEGLCFVDTLDLDVGQQLQMFGAENSERVQRQLNAPVTVIIGNPPYNVGQVNENDNNKNRVYKNVDARIRETYIKDSKATSTIKVLDMYVRFFRWSIDRLGNEDGVLVFVTNNSFVDQFSFDGFRKNIFQEFTRIYHLDLHGNVRQNPKLSGTTHNVFGIQVGVGITIAIRSKKHTDRKLFYHRVPEFATAVEKWEFLRHHVKEDGVKNALNTIEWTELYPNQNHTWIIGEKDHLWNELASIGSKDAKKNATGAETVFSQYCLGLATHRDNTVYNYSKKSLVNAVSRLIDSFNAEVRRYKIEGKPKLIDNFVDLNNIQWDITLKNALKREIIVDYNQDKLRVALYRPFTKKTLYFDSVLNGAVYLQNSLFPNTSSETENRAIVLTGPGSEKPFLCLVTGGLTDLHLVGAGAGSQCFPFYTYEPDGTRRDNITDWALQEFRTRSGISDLSKEDIFYYVYAALHEPTWRADFALNLKKELPRIPWPEGDVNVAEWIRIGRALAALHLGYETGPRQALEWVETRQPVHFRVTKMKRVGDSIVVNETLTLAGIPPVAWTYKLGNRSALEWLIDQYQVDGDSDPNAYSDDPMYIVNLIERVAYVSVQTMALVDQLEAQQAQASALGAQVLDALVGEKGMRINFFDKKVCTQFAYFIGVVSTALTCVSFFYNIGDIATYYYSRNVGFILFLVLLFLSYPGIFYWYKTKKSVTFMLDQTKFTIKIGDIFDQDGLKVIAFNEYFDTKVDDIIIAKSSLNGKYILRNEPDISELDTAIEQDTKLQEKIVLNDVKRNGKSIKYKLGSVVVRNDYLLLAFSKFDEDNRANLNYEEYAKCLLQFWKEIDRVYAGKNVVIPLMGNGITRIEKHTNITTQELYETILRTFLLSRIRLKNDAELILVVTSRDFHSIYPYIG